ncbi:uncharacterized protein [Nicotiana sylvestris]|uniref:uncharacterized protein n=1 Tax=Nicotiana sylvestris TaxID=4096 RepID=UPI00388C423C
MAEELKKLTSRVQGVEGGKGIKGFNYEDLCIQPDVELPKGYKPPKFEMFGGIGDPRIHLRTYCDKLVGVGKDNNIWMKLFMRSLTRDDLSWYISQDPKKWSNWVSMASYSMDRFRFNTENAPDVFYIQNLKKKPTETFRKYATHWRSEAAKLGKKIEEGIKSGMVTNFEALQTTNKALQSGGISKKKDVGAVMVAQGPKSPLTNQTTPPTYQTPPPTYQAPPPTHQEPPPTSPRYSQTATAYHTYNSQPSHFQSPPTRQNYPRPRPNFDHKTPRQYTVIAEPINQLYEMLKAAGYAISIPVVALENPSQWVNLNKTCAYHSGMKWHTIDECRTLKDKIHTLIDNKVIQEKEAAPNVRNNPLPDHRGDEIHVIEMDEE